MKMINDLSLALFKLQSAFGTAEAALIGTDVTEPSTVKADFNPVTTPIVLVGGGYRQNASIIGPYDAAVSLAYSMRTGGAAGVYGQWTLPLKCCGWKETIATNVATYTPSYKQSEWKDGTLWMYSGSQDTSAALVRKISNLMFTGKINFDFEKALATITFDGKGASAGAATNGTQPTITRLASLPQPLRGVTYSILGITAVEPLSIDIDFGQDETSCINPTNQNGKGMTLMSKQGMTWSAKVYRDVTTAMDPEALLLAGTTGALSVQWGTAPNKITVASTKAQLTKIGISESNGVETWDLSGILVDNDLSIASYTA